MQKFWKIGQPFLFQGKRQEYKTKTMTNTKTTDIDATLEQINTCVDAGADIIRVSCPDKESTSALKQIVKLSSIPIVADIHFHYLRAVEAADAGAACLRINPGNIGNANKVKELQAHNSRFPWHENSFPISWGDKAFKAAV